MYFGHRPIYKPRTDAHTHIHIQNQNKQQHQKSERKLERKRKEREKTEKLKGKKEEKITQENRQTGKKQIAKYKNMYGVGEGGVEMVMSNGKC